jgi:hypothetical protein
MPTDLHTSSHDETEKFGVLGIVLAMLVGTKQGAYHVELTVVPESAAGGSDPKVILESRTRKGMYLGWKGKPKETGDKLSMGVLDIKAIGPGVDSRERAQAYS